LNVNIKNRAFARFFYACQGKSKTTTVLSFLVFARKETYGYIRKRTLKSPFLCYCSFIP
jgi:hypothetical protein